jgi:conjugative relaxase-like TrwC/TraI family protein
MVFCWTFHQPDRRYSEYLSQGDNVIGIWIGKAATLEKFGVTAGTMVRHDDFSRLEAGKNAISGARLGQRLGTTRKEHRMIKGKFVEVQVSNRRSLYDFTVSLPKSLSVALLVGGRSDILAMHQKAVDRVAEEMERMTTCTRTRGKIRTKEVTGEFCAAKFLHFTNRSYNPDPSVHTHISVIPVTPTANGNYAIDATTWINQCSLLTALYRDTLAAEALKSGLELEIDKFGAPQIKSISDLNKKFSGRADDIEAMCECCESIVGSKLTDSERKRLVLQCRGIDIPGFQEAWEKQRERLTIQYIDDPHAQRGRKRFLKAFEAIVRSCSDQSPPEPKEVESMVDGWKERLDPEELHRLMNLETGSFPPRCVTVDQAVNFAIRHSFARDSVVADWRLATQALRFAQGANLDLEALRECIYNHKDLIFRGREATTCAHYSRECQIIGWVESGKGKGAKLGKVTNPKLTKHQLDALNRLLENSDQFFCLLGKAGVGKTFVIDELIKANVAQGYIVQAVAPSTKSRDVIDHIEEDKSTLQLFIKQPKLQSKLRPMDLLIVDEAGMADTEQIHKVMELAIKHRFRVCFAGDQFQNRSPSAGEPLRILLSRTKIRREWLSEILRQKPDALDGRYRRAIKQMSVGRITDGFATLDRAGAITIAQGQDRINQMADKFMSERALGRSVLVVNPSNIENDRVSMEIRKRLKESGVLGEEREILAHRGLGWTLPEKEELRNLRPGMILEITQGARQGQAFEVRQVDSNKNVAYGVNSDGLRVKFDKNSADAWAVCERRSMPIAIGDDLVTHAAMKMKHGKVKNGEEFTVKGFTSSGALITTTGKVIETKNLSHRYCLTSHASQSSTVDWIIFGVDKASDWITKQLCYVAASRGKFGISIYADNKNLLLVEKDASKKSAVELIKFVLDIARLKKTRQVQHQIDRAA